MSCCRTVGQFRSTKVLNLSAPKRGRHRRLRVEHDDRPEDFPRLHVGEAIIDLRQLDAGRDPVVEMQAALQVVKSRAIVTP